MNGAYILCVGKIIEGQINWDVSPLPMQEPPVDDVDARFDAPSTISYFAHLFPPDGALQKAIDYGAELQELIDDIEDREFIRRGC